MGKGLVIALAGFTIISLCPVFRGAGHSRHDGVNLWQLIHDSMNLEPDSSFGHPHILYDEAVELARMAWQNRQGTKSLPSAYY